MAMLDELPRVGGVAIQAEDEIAAIGMCIGASVSGARPMTATSGPGICLYSENLGLAIMGEVPLVVGDVQRLRFRYPVFFAEHNPMSKRTLVEMAGRLGFQTGVVQRQARPDYAVAWREAMASRKGQALREPKRIPTLQQVLLAGPFRLVAAGSAGVKLRSATRLLAEAAVLSGLWVTQREDYAVTVKSGHSIAELVISPDEIHYTGIERPDALVLLSADGLAKFGGMLQAMDGSGRVLAVPGLPSFATRGRVEADAPPAGLRLDKSVLGVFALAAAVRQPRRAQPRGDRGGVRAAMAACAGTPRGRGSRGPDRRRRARSDRA
jgi:hypothetical protein